jgi:tRNA dimethylallyltransferase
MSHSVAPLVVIVGPTASGKSDLAMDIAQKYNGELICADSRTVYVGMDIGTAKPSKQDRARVPHYLIDVVKPNKVFTAAEFKLRSLHIIDDIFKRGKLPIMVGGTGLYIDSVLYNYQFGALPDKSIRPRLESKSVEELQEICRQSNIELPFNLKNKRHLIRAIELGGLKRRSDQIRSNTLVVGITISKQALHKRIEQRAHAMLKAGIIEEVKKLGERYGWDNEAMTGNIYRVFKDVVLGSKTEEEAINAVINSDTSLIKRQLTWFKRNKSIQWGTPQELNEVVANFIKGIPRTS